MLLKRLVPLVLVIVVWAGRANAAITEINAWGNSGGVTTVNTSSGAQQVVGDVEVGMCTSGAIGNCPNTPPTGWTTIVAPFAPGGPNCAVVFGKVVAIGDIGATVTFPCASAPTAGIIDFRGTANASVAAAVDAAGAGSGANNMVTGSYNMSAASITLTNTGDVVIYFAGNAGSTTNTAPAGYSAGFNNLGVSGVNYGSIGSYLLGFASGATGTVTGTSIGAGNNNWTAVLVGLQPAAVATPTPTATATSTASATPTGGATPAPCNSGLLGRRHYGLRSCW